MATVTLSDDTLKFLRGLMTEVNTQDNRGTASPYYYCVQHDVMQPKPEGCGDTHEYINADGDTVAKDIPSLRKYLAENYPTEFINSSADDEGADDPAAELPEDTTFFEAICADALGLLDAMDTSAVEDAAEEHDIRHVEFSYEPVRTGFFFTREACEEHIRANGHHYRNPVPYVEYAFRNPELSRVLEALGEITGCGYTKH